MERSRSTGDASPARREPPAGKSPRASRLTLRPRKNRKRAVALWERVPRPAQVADACGRALRRVLPALVAVAVGLVLAGTAWAGYRFATHSPRFAITEIAVHGNQHLSADHIRGEIAARPGDNVFATDLGAVVRALRADPWIANASAHRVLPHTIAIEVREHVAAALVDLGGLYLADAQGRPFKHAEIAAGEGQGLPVVTGLTRAAYLADPDATAAQVRGALAALAAWHTGADRPAIGEVHLEPRGGLTLETYAGAVAIHLGPIDAGLPARMQIFDAAWAELDDTERARARAVHLDVRPDHVTVAFAQRN
jgi:cell division septal protein FtsQ